MKNRKMIFRVLNYKEVLKRMKVLNVSKVNYLQLAELTNVSPDQIRKDFSILKIKGNKKGGYIVLELLEAINKIIYFKNRFSAILVGYGKIGEALSKYPAFENEKIEIKACFDIDEKKFDHFANIPILAMDNLTEYLSKNKIDIAIITVPKSKAQGVFELLYFNKIRSFLNFSNETLTKPDDAIVHNINIFHEIEYLLYLMNNENEQK
jgi:redox-sensing transcriptional repressor